MVPLSGSLKRIKYLAALYPHRNRFKTTKKVAPAEINRITALLRPKEHLHQDRRDQRQQQSDWHRHRANLEKTPKTYI